MISVIDIWISVLIIYISNPRQQRNIAWCCATVLPEKCKHVAEHLWSWSARASAFPGPGSNIQSHIGCICLTFLHGLLLLSTVLFCIFLMLQNTGLREEAQLFYLPQWPMARSKKSSKEVPILFSFWLKLVQPAIHTSSSLQCRPLFLFVKRIPWSLIF